MSDDVRVKFSALTPVTNQAQVVPAINALIANVTPLVGQHKNKNERAVQWSDLLSLGLANVKGLTEDGYPDYGLPPLENPDMTTPPAIANFKVEASFNFVTMSWDQPRYRNHAFVEIWRAAGFKKLPDDSLAPTVLSDAVFRLMTASIVCSDTVLPGDKWRYWARNVSNTGVVGPWTSIDGHLAEVPEDPAYLIDKISGEIREGDLYPALGAKIDASYNGVNEHTQALVVVSNELQAHADSLAQHGQALVEVNNELQAHADSLVQHGQVLAQHTSTISAQGATITQQGSIIASQGDLLTQHTTTLSQHGNSITEQGRILTTHEATLVSHGLSLSTQNAAISDLKTITEAQDSVLAQHTSTISAQGATITEQGSIIASQGDLLAQHTSSISAQGATITQQGSIIASQGDLLTQHTTTLSQHGNTITEQGRILTTHEATLVSHGQSLATQNAAISDLKTVTEAQGGVLAQHTTQLTTANASITDLKSLTEAQGVTIAQHTTQIATANANITSVTQIATNQGQTLAEHTQILAAHGTAIQQQTTINTTQGALINAAWTVRIDSGNAVSGFGLMVDGASGRSDFIIRADRFAIAAPQAYDQNGKPVVNTAAFPFIVDVTNPASPKVLIKNAYIDQAFIQTLVTGSLVADRITGQTLTGTHIRGGDMAIGSNFSVDSAGSATMLNAFIKGTMQSSNYGAGVSGWQIHNNGNAEFNNAVLRGTIYATGGWFQGTVYAEKMVGGVYTKKTYSGQSQADSTTTSWRTATRVTVARGMGVSRKLEIGGFAGHYNMRCDVESSGSAPLTRTLTATYEVRIVRDGAVVEAQTTLSYSLSATSHPSSGPQTTYQSGGLYIGLAADVPADGGTHYYDFQFRFVRIGGDAGAGSTATAGCSPSDGSTAVMYIENGDLA